MDNEVRVLRIYLKGSKKPFAEIDGAKEEHFRDLLLNLNAPNMQYIKISDLIFKKEDFDYAELD